MPPKPAPKVAFKIPEIKGDVATFILRKSIAVIIGILVLIFAHFLGSFFRTLFVKKGKINLQELKNGEYTSAEIQKQAENTSLVFITLGNIVYYSIMIIAFISVLRGLGIEAASIIAVVGATGFAIGLALQGTLSDISSGILLALLQLYSVGDIIEVDGKQGEVKDFTLLNTVLEDSATKTYITIPNRKIQDAVLINHTKRKERFVVIDILVSNHNTNFKGMIEDIKTVIRADPKVSAKVEPNVGVENMTSVGTLLRARFMIDSADYPAMIRPLKTKIREMLAEKKVELVDYPM